MLSPHFMWKQVRKDKNPKLQRSKVFLWLPVTFPSTWTQLPGVTELSVGTPQGTDLSYYLSAKYWISLALFVPYSNDSSCWKYLDTFGSFVLSIIINKARHFQFVTLKQIQPVLLFNKKREWLYWLKSRSHLHSSLAAAFRSKQKGCILNTTFKYWN